MPASNSEILREGGSPTVARFGETHWSVILSAMDKQRPLEAADALERLCRVYWPPLYAYIRRLGESPIRTHFPRDAGIRASETHH